MAQTDHAGELLGFAHREGGIVAVQAVPLILLNEPFPVRQAEDADLSGAECPSLTAGELFVTPRGIDARVRDVSRLAAYAINLALHPGLTVEDVDMYLS